MEVEECSSWIFRCLVMFTLIAPVSVGPTVSTWTILSSLYVFSFMYILRWGELIIPGVSVFKVERNTAKRRREMIEAEHILREELERFRLWQQSLGKSLHTRSILTTFFFLLELIPVFVRCDSNHCEAARKG